jgi:hypothetical protein
MYRSDGQTAQEIIDALSDSGLMEAFAKIGAKVSAPTKNLPKNSTSLDIRRVSEVESGTEEEVFLSFTPPNGYEAIITHYGIFSDAQYSEQTEFVPKLNNSRVLSYHGTPHSDDPSRLPYRMALGLGPDLTDVAMIECQIRVKEGQYFEWFLTNYSDVSQTMGVRFKGYLKPVQQDNDFRIGG